MEEPETKKRVMLRVEGLRTLMYTQRMEYDEMLWEEKIG